MASSAPPAIRRWNPATMREDQVVIIAAPRGSGKSVLVAELLWHKRHIPSGIAMNATESSNKYYGKYLPPGFVYDDFSPDALERVLDHQKDNLAKLQKRGLGKDDLPPVFIIIDDCVTDPRFRKDPTLQYLFANGRHYKILLVIVTQFINFLTPSMRGNVDLLFLLRDNNNNAIKNYYQGWGGMFGKPDEFKKVFHVLTQDYCSMVLTNNKSTNIEECVFWYKAQIRRPFATGDRDFWRVNTRLYEEKPPVRKAKKEVVVRRIGYRPTPAEV